MSEVKRLRLDLEYPFQYREDTEGNLCYYADYAAIKAERDALAAENAALISAFMPKEIPTEATDNFSDTAVLRIDGDEFHSWQWVDNQDEVIRGVLSFFKPKSPATDAWLNSVRAEGADAVAAYHKERTDALLDVDRRGANEHKVSYMAARDVAAQLRAGEPS